MVRPTAFQFKRYRVGFEEQVQDTVDQRQVEGHREQNGFPDKHLERPFHVDRDDVGHEHLCGVVAGVNCPVAGGITQLGGTTLEDDGGVTFGSDEQCDRPNRCRHEQRDPSRPSPAQVRVDEESANNRPGYRPGEGGQGPASKSEASPGRAPHVGQRTRNDGQWRAAEQAGEESTNEDGVEVLGHGDRNLKNAEGGERSEQGYFSPIDFRHWAPDERTKNEPLITKSAHGSQLTGKGSPYEHE